MRRLLLLLIVLLSASPSAGALGTAGALGAERPGSIALPPGFGPEDLALGRGSTFYVGSLAGGAGVYAGDLRTGQGQILVPGEAGRTDVGVFVDQRNRLWVTGGAAGDVRVYDATSGVLLAAYELNPHGGFISDVVVTDDAAYLTDSFAQQLYVISLARHGGGLPDPGAARTVPLTGDIAYTDQPIAFNANGIVERGGRLIVGQTNTGQLFTVDPQTGRTREIDLGGADVFGADGIVLRGRTLFIAQNFPQSISVVELRGDLSSGRVAHRVADARFDIPTSVEVFGNSLYVLNARLTTMLTPQTTYDIVRVERP